jgi:hypothetical protein
MNPEDTGQTKARREFLKRVGSAAIVAPAVTLPLLARSRKALAGSGGNWNPKQTLDDSGPGASGQVRYPTGPLIGFTTADTVTWIDAWVVQKSTGASQASNHGPMLAGATTWTADHVLWKDGTFQKGVALGIALVSWKDAAGQHYYWWVDEITLV